MSRGAFLVLDAGPLGLVSKPQGKSDADRCRAWLWTIAAAGARVVIPEVADYEVRRELTRAGATAGLRRLDRLEAVLDYEPITTQAMRLAAEYWAWVRQAGVPTADRRSLDADCILAAQASFLGCSGDVVTIATTNPRHLARFPGIDARDWEEIAS